MNLRAKKYLPYFLLFVIGVLLVLSAIRDYYNKKILAGDTETLIAIITDITSGTGVRQAPDAKFYYFVKNKKYENHTNGNFNFMEVGDTVLIEYAIEDHSVARVVDKYYMKKYKYLKRIEK
mgnify:CR=1 FL=1